MSRNFQIKVDSVSNMGLKRTFVPVSTDEEFRNIQRNAWAFRLAAEFKAMKDLGWSVAFFTLTYDDRHLPIIPRCLWSDESKFTRLCAFSKHDVDEFILKLRKHLKKVYKIEGFKYMVCSELGPETKRSHYHGVICWPERPHHYSTQRLFKGQLIQKEWDSLPLSDFELHDFICRTWNKGFVRPRYASGGIDSHGHNHNPFKVDGDFQFCCKYAGKYCVKDLYFYDSLKDYEEFLDVKSPLFKRLCAPFHVQSKSLGASVLGEFTSDSSRMDLLLNGYQFLGSDKFLKIPVYIKNKLLFDTYYDIDSSGKRLVRRQANKFFRDNAKEIFDKKAEFYAEEFSKLESSGYLVGRGVDADNAYYVASQISGFLTKYNFSFDQLARSYLAWYGVDRQFCFDVAPWNQWLGRYIPNEQTHVNGVPLVDDGFLDDLDWCCNCIMFGFGLIPVSLSKTQLDRVSDYNKMEVA